MGSYFHCCSAATDPERLLDPDRQFSEPWGSEDHGVCDKCHGAGTTEYRCRSCMERGAEAGSPACQGRIHFRATCPTCEGSGAIDRTRRRGISVFPSREGLYRYLAEQSAGTDNRLIVTLEGRLSDEPDLDADAGALLVHPERIIEAQPLDDELVGSIRERLEST